MKPGHVQQLQTRGGTVYYHVFQGLDYGYYTREHPVVAKAKFWYTDAVSWVEVSVRDCVVNAHQVRKRNGKARRLALARCCNNMPLDTDKIVLASVMAVIDRGKRA